MAKYFSKIRAAKTIRDKVELLLDANPLPIEIYATIKGLIESDEELNKPWPIGNPEPLVYNHKSPEEVREFFAAYLEIFIADREKQTEERRAKQETRTHEIIDKLEVRFTFFTDKAGIANTSEIPAAKAIAKRDLDAILVSKLVGWEQQLIEIGADAYKALNKTPQEIATYITDKLEEHRITKKKEQMRGELTPVERALRILHPDKPEFFHRRFFQAFVGYKCEELKQAVDDYEPQSENETSSLGEWPISDEVLERFRAQQLSFKHLCVLCYAYNWSPRYYDPNKYSRKEAALKPFLERVALTGYLNNNKLLDGAKERETRNLTHLAKWLDLSEERTRKIVEVVIKLGINETAKARFGLISLD